MKTIFFKTFSLITATLIAGIAVAQSGKNSTPAFKEIHRKQSTDNFTAREIKKKELTIAPSQIISIDQTVDQPTAKDKYRKKKKTDR